MRFNTGTLRDIFAKTSSEIINNKNKLLFMLIFIIGLYLGKVLYLNNYEYLSSLISECFVFISGAGFTVGLAVLFALNAALPVISFFNGFNALGLPVITIIPPVCGILWGTVISCLYAKFNLNGVFYSILSIIPFTVVAVLFLISSCSSSIGLSSKTAKSVILGEPASRGEVRSFLFSHLIMLGIVLLCSLLQFLLIGKLTEKLLTV